MPGNVIGSLNNVSITVNYLLELEKDIEDSFEFMVELISKELNSISSKIIFDSSKYKDKIPKLVEKIVNIIPTNELDGEPVHSVSIINAGGIAYIFKFEEIKTNIISSGECSIDELQIKEITDNLLKKATLSANIHRRWKMPLVNKKEIIQLMSSNDLVITPTLEENQIGESTIDLRLGNIFRASKQIRESYMGIENKQIGKFFNTTYRDFGQDFILYPNQLVLASTFEFIKLPKNIMSHVYTRSSINRLGIKIASIVQPGYAGTLTLELINLGQTAIKVKSGMRIVQLVLFDVNSSEFIPYFKIRGAKYITNTEPKLSNISEDEELEKISSITRKNIL